jgi:hypothetical protein
MPISGITGVYFTIRTEIVRVTYLTSGLPSKCPGDTSI